MDETTNQQAQPIKRTVMDYDDIRQLVPFFDGKPRLVKWLMHLLDIDDVNNAHANNCDTPGVPFTTNLLKDLGVTMTLRNGQVLDNLPQGGFITVSNHPFGALDGIMLINQVGSRRDDFKVMVNMVLNYISAMRPNFIDVDALASDDPDKRAVSMKGIAQALRHVKDGHPLGFFPAGAVSKITTRLRLEDREWQPNVMRIIQKLQVPVIPIYFHGHNSIIFYLLGMISWKLRTLRLPGEVFRRRNYNFRISVGDPIMPEVQAQYQTPEQLAQFLKQQTYAMRKWQQNKK